MRTSDVILVGILLALLVFVVPVIIRIIRGVQVQVRIAAVLLVVRLYRLHQFLIGPASVQKDRLTPAIPKEGLRRQTRGIV
jgi:hypothetical protein